MERLERVTRERDRPSEDERRRPRRPPRQPQAQRYEDDDGNLHIDVRV